MMLACCVPLAATAYGLWWVVDRALGDAFAPQLVGLLLGWRRASAVYLWLTRRAAPDRGGPGRRRRSAGASA